MWDERKAHARAFLGAPPKRGHAWHEQHYAYDYQEDDMLYLAWYDDSKRPMDVKIDDAARAYAARFGTRPTVALVSEDDSAPTAVAGCAVRTERRIGRNNIHVGRHEDAALVALVRAELHDDTDYSRD